MMDMKNETINLNELDKLAKLLATENIAIRHEQVKTASFDTVGRVLRLPMWTDLTKSLYHMLVLHEIGHALYTDSEKWMNACTANPKIKSFLNIVEDPRIEKRVMQKYPGAVRDFRAGYSLLNDRDFFGIAGKDISKLSLGDRLNIHFKLGDFVTVPFSTEERPFIKMIEDQLTIEDAIRIAKLLLARAEEADEGKPGEGKPGLGKPGEESEEGEPGEGKPGEESEEGEPGEEGESGKGEPGEGEESEEGEPGEGDDDGDAGGKEGEALDKFPEAKEADGAGKKEKSPGEGGRGAGPDRDQKVSETDITTESSLEESLSEMIDETAKSYYVNIDSNMDWKDWVIDYKTINAHHRKVFEENNFATSDLFAKLRRKNIGIVDQLAREFETKKAADQYVRARESKTGTINPNKLHSYSMVEDIFKRVTTMPDSKNHGIVMFVDFSASMDEYMKPTIEQLLCLVMFCRKVGIPHRVYAFTDSVRWGQRGAEDPIQQKIHRGIMDRAAKARNSDDYVAAHSQMRLLELFSEKMSLSEFRDMNTSLLIRFGGNSGYNYSEYFRLGGTPFNDAIILARYILRDFKKETRRQIVSSIFLTDGDSGAAFSTKNRYFGGLQGNQTLFDPIHKKYVTKGAKQSSYGSFTIQLLDLLRSDGFKTVNFRIVNRRNGGSTILSKLNGKKDTKTSANEKLMAEFASNGCVSIDDLDGFDQYNWISYKMKKCGRYGRAQLDDENCQDEDGFSFDVKENATKGQITRAFIKAKSSRLNQRSLISKFTQLIAK